jgi:hypothetical protein
MDLTTSHGITIYRKTAKGLTEIETRVHKLSLKQRSVLIMVDGRLREPELRKVVGEGCDQLLQDLRTGGFIEPVGGAAETRPAAAPEASPPAPAAAAPVVAPAAPLATEPARLSPTEFIALRREAVRSLTDQIGPMAESLALKMEGARGWGDLKPLLVIAAQILANTRGRAAAEAYASRFIGS